jgi:hypothetical protein
MDSAAPKLSQRRSTKALTPQSTTIQLRCPDGQTSSSAHSGTRRSSSDPIRSSRPRAPMLAAPFPPASSCPSAHPTAPHRCRTPTTPFSKPCGLLRAAIPPGPVFLATADRPSPRSPPPNRRASTTDAPASRREGRDLCDTMLAGELPVPLSHNEVHSPPSPSAPAWRHSSKQSPCCKSVSSVSDVSS